MEDSTADPLLAFAGLYFHTGRTIFKLLFCCVCVCGFWSVKIVL